ncbi:formin-binding protein [Mycoemilia scoparia]|uniref:Formin-binding protein n=1 Tax=Mycoemilia scoparia TaxID=417184 RepID=A0A9W8AAJ8_9FUNG|nr:formin-binding protein [Mycoemilia scoparia]
MKYNLVFSKNKDGQTKVKSVTDPTADNDKGGQSSSSTLGAMVEASKSEISSSARFSENFWSDDDRGVEVVMKKMQSAKQTLTDIHRLFASRAQLEEEYGKKLLKLSRAGLGSEELGTTLDALHTVRSELEESAGAHLKLGKQFREELAQPLYKFIEKQRQKRKQQQAIIQKTTRDKSALRSQLIKIREKKDAEVSKRIELERLVISMQEMVDPKLRQKLEKAQALSRNAENEYKETQRKLIESDHQWFSVWQSACDVFQILEEERIEYMKTALWEYANIISGVCVTDDASMEKIRQELEKVDVDTDIEKYIQKFRTGSPSKEQEELKTPNTDGENEHMSSLESSGRVASSKGAPVSSSMSRPVDQENHYNMAAVPPNTVRKVPLTPQQTPQNSLSSQPSTLRPPTTNSARGQTQAQPQPIPPQSQTPVQNHPRRNDPNWQTRPGTSMQQHSPHTPQQHPSPYAQQPQYRRASGTDVYYRGQQPPPQQPQYGSPQSRPYQADPRAPSSMGGYPNVDPRAPSVMGQRPPTSASMYGPGPYQQYAPSPEPGSIPRHRSSTFTDSANHPQYASLNTNTNIPPQPAYADPNTYRANSAPSSPVYHHRRANSGTMMGAPNGASPGRPGSQGYYHHPPPPGGQPPHPPPVSGYQQPAYRTETPLPGGNPAYPGRSMTPGGRPPTQQTMHSQSPYHQQAPPPPPTSVPAQYAPSPTPSHNLGTIKTQSSASLRQPQGASTIGRSEDTRPVLFYVRALHDYTAEQPEEISLRERMVVSVLATNLDGWWEGEITDPTTGELKRGLFPSNFTDPLEY